ncbi:hypothetical protein D9M68_937140 [compost metagenome]
MLHFADQVIPYHHKFGIQQIVFDQHFKFKKDGFGGMQGIRKNKIEFLSFQFCPAAFIPYIGRQIIDWFLLVFIFRQR